MTNLNKARQLAEQLEQIAQHFDNYNNGKFISAFFLVVNKSVFCFEQFLRKIKLRPELLQRCATINQYVDMIERAFNYKSTKKVSLRYSD